jgi:hypothetical protein
MDAEAEVPTLVVQITPNNSLGIHSSQVWMVHAKSLITLGLSKQLVFVVICLEYSRFAYTRKRAADGIERAELAFTGKLVHFVFFASINLSLTVSVVY